MTDRPHLLYVAWGFPPCRGGGVYRALATANRFAALGWKVTVLTADRDTFFRFTGADLTLEERVDPSVEVVRVPFEWPILEADLRKWSKRRAQNPKLWSKWRTKQDQIPVRQDLLDLFELSELEKYFTDEEVAQHPERSN